MKEKLIEGHLFCSGPAYRGVILEKTFTCALKFLAGHQAERLPPREGPFWGRPASGTEKSTAQKSPRDGPSAEQSLVRYVSWGPNGPQGQTGPEIN